MKSYAFFIPTSNIQQLNQHILIQMNIFARVYHYFHPIREHLSMISE